MAITVFGPRCLLEASKTLPKAFQEPSEGPQLASRGTQQPSRSPHAASKKVSEGRVASCPCHCIWNYSPELECLCQCKSFCNRFQKALGRGAVHIKSPITLAKFLGIANVHTIFVLLCRLRNCKGHLLCHSVLRIWTACQNVHLCLELKKLRFEHLLL